MSLAKILNLEEARELIKIILSEVKNFVYDKEQDTKRLKKLHMILDFLKQINHIAQIYKVDDDEIIYTKEDVKIVENYINFLKEKSESKNLENKLDTM